MLSLFDHVAKPYGGMGRSKIGDGIGVCRQVFSSSDDEVCDGFRLFGERNEFEDWVQVEDVCDEAEFVLVDKPSSVNMS